MKLKLRMLVPVIFLVTIAVRLFIAYQTPYFSDDRAYFVLRQVEAISESGLPITHDAHSFGGRVDTFSPLFYYLLAFFNLFLPLSIVAKVIPNIFASSLVIVAYYLAKSLTQDERASVVVSFVSGMIPIFVMKTVNSVSPYSIVIPLIAFSLLCFVKLREKTMYVYLFIGSIAALTFLHPSALVICLTLIFYLFLLYLDGIDQQAHEMEIILFSTSLCLWFITLIFKKSLYEQGLQIVWQNIPVGVLSQYFADITIFDIIAQIGMIPFLFGVVTMVRYLLRKRDRFMYVYMSFAIVTLLLLWLRLIEVSVGLMLLGFIMTILYSSHFSAYIDFIGRTKLASLRPAFISFLIIGLLLTSGIPTITYANDEVKNGPTDDEIAALEWISVNTPENSTVLGPLNFGHKITQIARRKNVIDNNFLNIKNAQDRYADMIDIYGTPYTTQATRLLNRYDVDYIILREADLTGSKIALLADEDCFEQVFQRGNVMVLKLLCVIED